MADVVTSQTIQDGGRNLIMKFTNVSDGSGESAVKKVDVSALSSDPMTGKECTRVAISKIQFSTVGMSVKVEFDSSTNEWKIRKNSSTGAVQKGKKVSVKLAASSSALSTTTNENIEIYSVGLIYRDLKVK